MGVMLLAVSFEELAHHGRGRPRLSDDLPPGEPEDVVAEQLQLRIAGSVGFEACPSGVSAVPVQLDYEAASGPEKIGNEGADRHVHGGTRDAVAPTEGEEAGLQLAAGPVWFQGWFEREAQELRLAQGCCELRLGKEAAEVRQCAGWGCDWDAGSPGYAAGEEGGGSMDSDPLASPSLAWDGDVHETPLGKELPERRRAGVTENRIRAAGEHGRHPSAFLAEAAMADGVNTAMNAVQPLGLDAPSDALAPNSESLELGERNHAVLIGRKPCDRGVLGGVGKFLTHVRE
jgi:hypothetical protein